MNGLETMRLRNCRQWLIEGRPPIPWKFAAIATLAIVVPPALVVALFGSEAVESLSMAAFLAAMPAYFAAQYAGIAIAMVVTVRSSVSSRVPISGSNANTRRWRCFGASAEYTDFTSTWLVAGGCGNGFIRA